MRFVRGHVWSQTDNDFADLFSSFAPMPARVRAMRVLALISDGFGVLGGIGAYNEELLNALGDCRQVSHVRVLPRFAKRVPDNTVLVQDSARENPCNFTQAALAHCLREPFDWVFCGHLHYLPLARFAAALCGARVWLQLHGIEAGQRPGMMTAAAALRCDLVTAVSRFSREQFLSWCDIDPQRVKVLSNTFAAHFTPGPRDARLRERLAPNGEAVVLTVSRVQRAERYKGHEQVMLAMLEAPLQEESRAVYVIAGGGDDVAYLRWRALELGLEDRVHFMGAVDSDALCALYRSADVFAMPSDGEGFGIVFLEAAACGLPVIAGDVDGSRDALRDGLLGRLVDPHNPVAIAAAIAAVLAVAEGEGSARTVFEAPPDNTAGGVSGAVGDPPVGRGVDVFSRENFRAQLQHVMASVCA